MIFGEYGKTGDLIEFVDPGETYESGDFCEITDSHESDDLVNLLILCYIS